MPRLGPKQFDWTQIFRRIACLAALAGSLSIGCGGGKKSGAGSGGAGGADSGSAGVGGSAGHGGQGGWPPCNVSFRCPACGDGVQDQGEDCDDGNKMHGDGCNGLCQVEANWNCWQGYCRKISICGDGRVTEGEACDDSNLHDGDGCSSDCLHIKLGWYCPVIGMPCKSTGTLIPSLDAGTACHDPQTCVPNCGNGMLEVDEECDDGLALNTAAHNDDNRYGGCTTQCRLGPRCGDGMVNGEETCDLGSANGTDLDENSCTLACTKRHFCGDGLPDGDRGEECDLGALNGQPGQDCDQACKNVSTPKVCIYCL